MWPGRLRHLVNWKYYISFLTVRATLFLFFRPLMSFVLFPRNLFCLPRRLRQKNAILFFLACFSTRTSEPQQRFGIVNVCFATALRARLELNPRSSPHSNRHSSRALFAFVLHIGRGNPEYTLRVMMLAKDGVPTMIGECAVRVDVVGMSPRVLTNGTGRLSLYQHSDETQGYLCQGYGIECTSTRAFLIQSSLLIPIQVKIHRKGCA